MGADLVRGGFTERRSPLDVRMKELEEGLAVYKEHGMKAMYNLSVPDSRWDNKEQLIDDAVEFVETAARTYGDMIPYWEHGNEPNLTFFYRDSMEEYTDTFIRLYDGVKKGSPNSIVMNGGLCYLYSDRSRKFIELIPRDKIDGIAYHGHGYGAKSERRAHNKMRNVMKMYNKEDIPILGDTESGYSAKEKNSEYDQAVTCAQKMIYGRSENMLLFWFRVWTHHNYSSTNPDDKRQPRPAILAYRNVVEMLRGFVFKRHIALRNEDIFAYLFSDGNQQTCVVWNEGRYEQTVALQTGQTETIALYDVYGNQNNLPVQNTGIAEVSVSAAPIFLKWVSEQDSAAEAPRFLDAPVTTQLVSSRENDLTLTVNNTFGKFIDGVLKIDSSKSGLNVTPTSIPIRLRAGEKKAISLTASVAEMEDSLWPAQWSIHADCREPKPKELGNTKMTFDAEFNDQIQGDGSNIDFSAITGEIKEKAPAVCIGVIDSDKEQTIAIGVQSDWWRLVCLNGKVIEDTRSVGHGAGEFHELKLPLKKGKNILGICVLSGSKGWRLNLKSPEEIQRSQGGGRRLTYRFNGLDLPEMTAESKILIQSPLSEVTEKELRSGKTWQRISPIGKFGEKHMNNLFVTEPDSKRWWKGSKDLSGKIQTAVCDHQLLLRITVTDNNYTTDGKIPDSIELKTDIPGLNTIKINHNKTSGNGWSADIQRNAGKNRTIWTITLNDISKVGKTAGVQLTVFDNDNGLFKQTAVWPSSTEQATLYLP